MLDLVDKGGMKIILLEWNGLISFSIKGRKFAHEILHISLRIDRLLISGQLAVYKSMVFLCVLGLFRKIIISYAK